jgi:hypothetical protein
LAIALAHLKPKYIIAKLPENLKDVASYIQCNKCGRKSFGGENINAVCNMSTPSGTNVMACLRKKPINK